MTSANRELVDQFLQRISAYRSTEFAGLGVVFYAHLNSLPHLPLDVQERGVVSLPIMGIEAITAALKRYSETTSPWHDGFHFVELTTMSLTHLAHFISPPIPSLPSQSPAAAGARHMAAALACKVDGILAVGLLSSAGEKSIYIDIKKA